jgi:hypothetical protein
VCKEPRIGSFASTSSFRHHHQKSRGRVMLVRIEVAAYL